jgi:hypothetical protein
MWNDGICDPNCQNLECEFNDCSISQVLDSCVAAQQSSGVDYTSPASDADLSFTAHFERPFFFIDPNLDMMVYSATLDFTLTWSDSRMANAPCHDVLPSLLSATEGVASRYRNEFWVPSVYVHRQKEPDRAAEMPKLSEVALAGLKGVRGNDIVGLSEGYARSTGKHKVEVYQSFNYVRFPFDRQWLLLDIDVAGANLSCSRIAAHINPEALLPEQTSWATNGVVHGRHPVIDGDVALSRCELTLPLTRIATVYIVQHLLPLLIVCMGALLVLNLNPTSPPLKAQDSLC